RQGPRGPARWARDFGDGTLTRPGVRGAVGERRSAEPQSLAVRYRTGAVPVREVSDLVVTGSLEPAPSFDHRTAISLRIDPAPSWRSGRARPGSPRRPIATSSGSA